MLRFTSDYKIKVNWKYLFMLDKIYPYEVQTIFVYFDELLLFIIFGLNSEYLDSWNIYLRKQFNLES